ncbi:hypothetical protein [Streptomyces cylindrosporus]|uniref:Uncharacterized protein n=1 Tax=Streptomyces cylindrosporus TaxID=2927583 RepID=A0ABS9YHH7_9ACTN|nr:hypothetical protein [Streptomyces cylindrosporus]MCI3276702.1 hypothetical protein [Streptomyces cylindrosporus]
MASGTVQPAVRELMARCSPRHELNTTVTLGGDNFTLCAHIRVKQVADDQAKVSLACWAVSTDLARYIGGHPPTKDEHQHAPYGTAKPDADFTGRVIGHLATRMNALNSPQPDRDGHLAVTVPLIRS